MLERRNTARKDDRRSDWVERPNSGLGSASSPASVLSATLRYRWALIAGIAALSVLAGLAYIATRPPSFTAVTQLNVETRVLQMMQDAVFTAPSPTGNAVQTEIEILKSPKTALHAVELVRSPAVERLLAGSSLSGTLVSAFRPQTPPAGQTGATKSDALHVRSLASELQKLVQVRRVGGTSIIEVLATAPDADTAAAIANGVARAYLADQAAANAAVAKTASAWVRSHVKDAGTSTRIVSEAVPPQRRDGPRALHVLAAALLLGIMAGFGTAVGAEAMNHRVRSEEELEAITGAPCLGALPRVEVRNLAGLAPSRVDCPSKLGSFDPVFDASLVQSQFREVVRRVAVATTIERPGIKALAVTSCYPGEGKTTVAVNVARTLAEAGVRTLLVDAATQEDDTPRTLGLISAREFDPACQSEHSAYAVWKDPVTGLDVLPVDSAANLLWARKGDQFLRELAEGYDLLLFDLPSISRTAYVARAAAIRLDGVLLVVQYNRVRSDDLRRSMALLGSGSENLLGTILNRAK